MRTAEYADKGKIISILTESFFDNKSVNYIVQSDEKVTERIRFLMEYSFELCLISGEVFITGKSFQQAQPPKTDREAGLESKGIDRSRDHQAYPQPG